MKIDFEEELLQFCGVPRKLVWVLKEKEVEPLHEPGISAYYWGPTGTGKSTAAAAALRRDLFRSINVKHQLSYFDPSSENYTPGHIPHFTTQFRFINIPELFFLLRTSMAKKNSVGDEIVEQCKGAKLLVLDDLGAEMLTEWTYQVLYLIINSRFDSMKPTIFTSNFSLEELGAKISDERLISRVLRMCEGNIFHLKGWKA